MNYNYVIIQVWRGILEDPQWFTTLEEANEAFADMKENMDKQDEHIVLYRISDGTALEEEIHSYDN